MFFDICANTELGVFEGVTGDANEVVNQIEAILEEYSSENEDYETVMSYGSVYRYSVLYWSDEGYRDGGFVGEVDTRWFNWVSFGMADLSGAYSGAAYGATTGAAGAIGGAVGFGLMNSAYNAAIQAVVHKL
ncbi:MAG TPA: hypothetical protein VFD80_06000 [Flavobacteriaceae bacterium]|nr:hypothetical protein [Flavobacteriaceae bacterium]